MFKEDVIHDLFKEINKNNNENFSLLGGKAGRLLFNYYYLSIYYDKPAVAKFYEEIQELAENSFTITYPTFCNGFAGVNWFFRFLNQKGSFLDDEDIALICDRDIILEKESLNFLSEGNYDFLHGAVGVAYYLLYKNPNNLNNYFAQFFELLKKHLILNEIGGLFTNYDFANKKSIPDEINLGLAHGIPSILKFCIQCLRKGVCVSESRYIADNLIRYLINHSNLDSENSTFPNIISKSKAEKDEVENSRLSWCYGDLGIGFVLYQAGVVLQDLNVQMFAKNVLQKSCSRKLPSDTMVKDACICHGAAGIAHIYNKMWYYTKEDVFKSASLYWLQETLNLRVSDQGVAGYKMYRVNSSKYENAYGLLEGAAGVGLVLLSFMKEDFSWDYCLMLND